LWHSIYWAEEIINKFYLNKPTSAPLKILLRTFIKYAEWKGKTIERKLGLTPIQAQATPTIRNSPPTS
ncbi:MAG: hypothetical protein QXK19_03660, partial [Nitrososphaerota archaeon]